MNLVKVRRNKIIVILIVVSLGSLLAYSHWLSRPPLSARSESTSSQQHFGGVNPGYHESPSQQKGIVENASRTKKNVLFLIADDLRAQINPWAGPYFPDPTHPKMHTPHLDELASRSLVLERGYCQFPLCGPSRASFLTSRRPDTTRVYDLDSDFWKTGGNFTTLPQYFKNHGYTTIGVDKIFHQRGVKSLECQHPPSWDDFLVGKNHHPLSTDKGRAWKAVPAHQQKLPMKDQRTVELAVKSLQEVAPSALAGDKPFFLAVGLKIPHLPWVFPAKYLDLYPLKDVKPPPNFKLTKNLPPVAFSSFYELWRYIGIGGKVPKSYNPSKPINLLQGQESRVLELRRAYYAAVSYVDDLIGEILSELDTLGLRNSTIVSFIGDHGYQLGENAEWAKHTLFDVALQTPMMLSIPGLTDRGVKSTALTEMVDIFPSLVDAANLPSLKQCPANSQHVHTCTEGTSFLPLIQRPKHTWKDAAYSLYARLGWNIKGYSIKTDRYRFTRWPGSFTRYRQTHPGLTMGANSTDLFDEDAELYDHQEDPWETVNLAYDKKHRETVTLYRDKLEAGWRSSLL